MPKPTDIRIQEVTCDFETIPFRCPLKFGGRVITQAVQVNVSVVVETRDGKQHAAGMGSMPLGNVWAWPSEMVSVEQSETAMKSFAEAVVELANDCPELGHPIDLVHHLSAEYEHQAKRLSQKLKLQESIPELARLVAASPFDAALHDAFGRLHKVNSFDTLSSKFMSHDLSEYLDASFKGEFLDKYTAREPQSFLPLYHLVGALDPLAPSDVEKKIGDGLPETLGEWIAFNGLTHLKIKLAGNQFDWDRDRILAVDRVASEAQAKRNCSSWWYSLDFNEKCPNVEYVVDLLQGLRETNPAVFDRIQYLEQPMPRDLKAHPEFKVHAAAALKPVVIDESLTDYDALLISRELGYTGVALKACKGQTESLLMGAAAQKFGLFLCVQDLTCPGASFLHSASLAAHIPGIAAIEGNGRQYCPGPNKRWAKHFPGMFDIKDGRVQTGLLNGPGLGF